MNQLTWWSPLPADVITYLEEKAGIKPTRAQLRLFCLECSKRYPVGPLAVLDDQDTSKWMHILFTTLVETGRPDAARFLELGAYLLRDQFDFWLVIWNPCWNTPDVLSLANAIVEKDQYDDTLILADALEDAGCNLVGILDHLRHTRLRCRRCQGTRTVVREPYIPDRIPQLKDCEGCNGTGRSEIGHWRGCGVLQFILGEAHVEHAASDSGRRSLGPR